MIDPQGRAALEPTQAAKDAAAEYLAAILPDMPNLAKCIRKNPTALARAFDGFRIASSSPAEPVAWRYTRPNDAWPSLPDHVAITDMRWPDDHRYRDWTETPLYAAPVTPPAGEAEGLVCPFCSGVSVVRQDDDPGYPFYVTFEHTAECPMYAVPTDLFKSYRTEVEAIAAWTSRPSITTSPVNSGNILVGGQEYVPLEAYREAMSGWKAANALTPVAGDAELRKALEVYDATVKRCPANTQFLGDKKCPRCSAGPDEGCRQEIRSASDVIAAVRTFLAPAPSVPAQQGEESP